eukprot:scaffold17151_cov160-Amphora_coffeaeformis.AAC.6
MPPVANNNKERPPHVERTIVEWQKSNDPSYIHKPRKVFFSRSLWTWHVVLATIVFFGQTHTQEKRDAPMDPLLQPAATIKSHPPPQLPTPWFFVRLLLYYQLLPTLAR